MRQTLWGAVALAGWLAFVSLALCLTSPADQPAVRVIDAVVACAAVAGALVGSALLLRSSEEQTQTETAAPRGDGADERVTG